MQSGKCFSLGMPAFLHLVWNLSWIALDVMGLEPSSTKNTGPVVRLSIYEDIVLEASIQKGKVRDLVPLPTTVIAADPAPVGGSISPICSA